VLLLPRVPLGHLGSILALSKGLNLFAFGLAFSALADSLIGNLELLERVSPLGDTQKICVS
jgi:hypothetical protein